VFGKPQRGVSERPNKPKKPLIPTWLGTLVVILIVLSFLVALMLWKPWEPVKARGPVGIQQTTEQTSDDDYRFYDLLPQQQVTPIPDQAVPETKTEEPTVIVEVPSVETPVNTESSDGISEIIATVEVKPTYILQVGSFKSADSADARRAEIILNGLSADILQTNEDGEIWYRVVSSQYSSQEDALIAQQRLQSSGIDSIVVKH
jgi:cell division protein FtsN